MDFMIEALKEAKKAYVKGEVPIGAVVVYEGKVIGRGHNLREQKNQAISHAEMEALVDASNYLGNWRLTDCDLYVTIEPCPMCAGAIINARIKNVYFGAYDAKAGACGSKINLLDCGFNHRPNIHSGILAVECKALMKDFFKELRRKD